MMIVNTLLLAAGSETKRENRVKQQIKIEMQKEKQHAADGVFHGTDTYDFKGAEVNKDSLESVPELEPQYDFDMNNVYD